MDGGGNLQFEDKSCGASIPVGDPKLGPLADNGGPTLTLALFAGSAAIGAGDSAICASALNNLDQRGFSQQIGTKKGLCDSGAIQHDALAIGMVSHSIMPISLSTVQ